MEQDSWKRIPLEKRSLWTRTASWLDECRLEGGGVSVRLSVGVVQFSSVSSLNAARLPFALESSDVGSWPAFDSAADENLSQSWRRCPILPRLSVFACSGGGGADCPGGDVDLWPGWRCFLVWINRCRGDLLRSRWGCLSQRLYWTVRRQTNSRSVKSRTSQLVD